MKCFRIKIVGHVRGNGFRSAALDAAYRFGVRGFVQFDGGNSLSMEAEGDPDDLCRFVQFCRDWFTSGTIHDFIVSDKELENYHGFTIQRGSKEDEELRKSQAWIQKIKDMIRP